MNRRLSTGVEGLDEVLRGGLLPGQIYMIRGAAGSGKTTLGLEFLRDGAGRGESTLFISMVEPERGMRASAETHGWDLAGIEILDVHVGLGDEGFSPEGHYTIFPPADVELAPITRKIMEAMDRLRPSRVVFD